MILVSACLAGCPCRYDGKANPREDIIALVKAGEALPLCPEQLGGLCTPRIPCERDEEGRILCRDGSDKTASFRHGAEAVLELCRLYGIRKAILKARSPSCGVGVIYDGTFSGMLREGNGLCAQLLMENGIEVACRD